MKICRRYFQHSGKFSGVEVLWGRYRTYFHFEYGWKGHWPKDLPRLLRKNWKPNLAHDDSVTWKPSPWWYGGSLMLIDRRLVWDTQLK